ncbi:MAG: dTMP kinase [Candidatus Omnitrophica bacterium]|nr:dTMP kinase [Candidatus Omnitrophota bacterium]
MAKKALKRGVLLTFEGPEGSGKSTQVRLLCSWLRRKGFSVLRLREPGSTRVGEKIRKILLNPSHKGMDVVCEMLLYQAARAQLVKEKVLTALGKKQIVILDRYLDATVCYQGYGAGLDIGQIKKIGRLATYGCDPDLTILLDLEVREGLRRARRLDRMEKKPIKFHSRVRKGYLALAKKDRRRIKVVKVAPLISETQRRIRSIVGAKIGG